MAETYDTAALPDRMTQFVPHAAALGMELVSIGHGQGVRSWWETPRPTSSPAGWSPP